MSLPLTFDKTNMVKVAKVFAYTVGSAFVALLVNLVPFIHSTNAIVLLAETVFVNNIAVALEQWFGHQEQVLQSSNAPASNGTSTTNQ